MTVKEAAQPRTPRQPIHSAIKPPTLAPTSCPIRVAPMKRLRATCRIAKENLSPIRAMHTGMIPPAATPPRTRLRNSSFRSGAKVEASRQSARTDTAILITTALPKASPVGPRKGWLRPKGRAKAVDSSATTLTGVEKSAAMEVMSGSKSRVASAPENPHRERINRSKGITREEQALSYGYKRLPQKQQIRSPSPTLEDQGVPGPLLIFRAERTR